MRKYILSILLVLVLATTGWGNMLLNPGFEAGPDAGAPVDWTTAGNVYIHNWAQRTGTNGLVFQGWSAPSGTVQQVVAGSAGTYTFSIWVLRQTNYLAGTLGLSIAWLDGADSPIQPETATLFTVPNEGAWHQLFVTGTCSSSQLAKVRVTLFGDWVQTSGDCSLMLDDADLYAGAYAGSYLSSGNFEYNGAWKGAQWNGTSNLWGWGTGGQLGQNWANHSGTAGVSMVSWDSSFSNYSVTFWQNVNPVPSTGVFAFAAFIQRETNSLFSNAVMTIQWYDTTFTNKVQDDTVTNLTIPAGSGWTEYHVEGISTSPAMYEARVMFSAAWSYNTNVNPDQRSTMFDDARFLVGGYDVNALNEDWLYHAAPGYAAAFEPVPQTNVGPFLQRDDSTTNVTFYLLGNNPSSAKYYPQEDGKWEMRTSWWDPTIAGWSNRWESFAKVGTINLDSGSPFHGAPTSGAKTVDLWKYVWKMPLDLGGSLITNNTQVFYAPFYKSTNGVQQTDWMYLLWNGMDARSNNFRQLVGDDYGSRDYVFELNPHVWDAFTNGGFEFPLGTNLMDSSGWAWFGDVTRETWAARTGDRGGRFPSWSAGRGGVWQSIASTGGTYTFSLWLTAEAGFNPQWMQLKIEWYNADGRALKEDALDLMTFPRDGAWHQIYVTSTCLSNGVAYARPVFDAAFGNELLTPSATMFDDAEFYPGSFRGSTMVNPSFEKQGSWRNSGWNGVRDMWGYGSGGMLGQNWANHSGTSGVAFYSYDENSNRWAVTFWQNVNPVTGTGRYNLITWINYETNSWFSNATLSIQWYDRTLTNKVQADTVSNLNVLKDWQWHSYLCSGVCTSPAMYEARAVFSCEWAFQPTNMTPGSDQGRAIKLDDMWLVYGDYDGTSVITDWSYHSARDCYPVDEQVPGGVYGAFRQVNYVTGTNTFYALADSPTVAKYVGEGGAVGMRVSWNRPEDGAWMNTEEPMTKIGSLVLDSGSPFHGLPAAGSKTVDVWKFEIAQPRELGGAAYTTNLVPYYYAPYLYSTIDVVRTDTRYLLYNGGDLTNNLGQHIGTSYGGKDYLFWNRVPAPLGAFTNGGFENGDTNQGSGWLWCGRIVRTNWSAHSGAVGAAFESWNTGDSALYQEVDTTGGVYCFSTWFRMQPYCNPIDVRIRMEWYNTAGQVVQVDERNLTSYPKSEEWSKIAVVGQCLAPSLDFVKLGLVARYGDNFGGNSAIQIDDAEFFAVGTNVLNAGFETGAVTMDDWYGDLVSQQPWANHSGSNGAASHGWATSNEYFDSYLTQPVAGGNGTYTFAIWLARESDYHLTNAELRIQWFDSTWTNKVQADTVQSVTIPGDNGWRQYAITGTCSSVSLAGIQPTVFLQLMGYGPGSSRSLKMDDATVTFTSGGGYTDGIPDWWWDLYGVAPGDRLAAGDIDNDGYLNIEEYGGDTHPTNGESFFHRMSNLVGKATATLYVNPSSTGRVYDVYWRSNLIPENLPWTPYGLSVTGLGGQISLTVTNLERRRYYRTGAHLP